jgi:hypothetical protein
MLRHSFFCLLDSATLASLTPPSILAMPLHISDVHFCVFDSHDTHTAVPSNRRAGFQSGCRSTMVYFDVNKYTGEVRIITYFRTFISILQRAVTILGQEYTVSQLADALRYKPKGRGFDSRWCHWNFSLA